MRIAILYTGEFRTCKKTMHYTKTNILLNDDVHIFAIIQSQYENIDHDSNFIKSHMGLHIKHLMFFNKTNQLWNSIQDELLHNMSIHNNTHTYLKNSGSMIEYYQAYLAYQQVLHYEQVNSIKYDYIVRLRTDVIYTQPLTFDFLNLTTSDIIDNFKLIQKCTQESSLLSVSHINMFFNNILCDHNKENRLKTNYSNCDIHYNSEYINNAIRYILNDNVNDYVAFKKIREIIHEGKYIITLRKNVFFVIKRDLYSRIVNLGITYGKYIGNNNNYWWNAESQLQEVCKVNEISIFDSTTLLEDKSLYEFQENNYFNNDNNIADNLHCLFFICRN